MRAVASLMMVPGAGKQKQLSCIKCTVIFNFPRLWNVYKTKSSFFTDKHPQLNEFLTQIKNTPDLANLFESIQKDSNASGAVDGYPGYSSGSGAMSMDLS